MAKHYVAAEEAICIFQNKQEREKIPVLIFKIHSISFSSIYLLHGPCFFWLDKEVNAF